MSITKLRLNRSHLLVAVWPLTRLSPEPFLLVSHYKDDLLPFLEDLVARQANRRIPVSHKSPQGIWPCVPCGGKQTGSPLDQWDMVRIMWDCRLSTISLIFFGISKTYPSYIAPPWSNNHVNKITKYSLFRAIYNVCTNVQTLQQYVQV